MNVDPREPAERFRDIENRLRRVESRFPRNALTTNIAREGHIHYLAHMAGGAGGMSHYDYVVDSAYTGAAGAVITLAGGSTSILYATIQAAIDAADASNADASILINEGTYNEDLTIASTWGSGHDLWVIGEAPNKVVVGTTTPSTADALTISDADAKTYWRNINFRGGATAASGHSVVGTVSNVSAVFEDCIFDQEVSADFAGAWFRKCWFKKGYDVDTGHSPATVFFDDCQFDTASTWTGSIDQHYFTGCLWGGSTDTIISTGNLDGVHFANCTFDTSGAGGTKFTKNGGSCSGLVFDGCDFGIPGVDGAIYLQSTTGSVGCLLVTGCHFAKSTTRPYIKSADADVEGVEVSGNSFGRDGSGNYVEDSGGVSITGIFKKSVFGPNTPPTFAVQLDATSAAPNVYIGTGVVSGAEALTATANLPQRGAGPPSHVAPEGTFYWDITNNNLYQNNDGSTGWTAIGGATAIGGTPRYNFFNTAGQLDSWLEGAAIASATSLVLGTDGDMFHVTGTTTITSIATPTRQTLVLLIFDGVLTFTHGANLILQGAANLTTAAGDCLMLAHEGAGVWREINRHTAAAAAGGITPRFNIYGTTTLDSWLKGADIASAATLTLGTDGDYFHVTGVTTITAFAAPTRQTLVVLVFDGILTLTHSANLILSGSTNYVTAAGDCFIFAYDGTIWREITRHIALGDNIIHYDWGANAAPGVAVSSGSQQGGIKHSGPFPETAIRLYAACEGAATASWTARVEYGDTDDLDTVSSWTVIADRTMTTNKGDLNDSMTTAAIPANRLLRFSIPALSDASATLKDVSVSLRVRRV